MLFVRFKSAARPARQIGNLMMKTMGKTGFKPLHSDNEWFAQTAGGGPVSQ